MRSVEKTFGVDPENGRELRYVGVGLAGDVRAEMLPPRPFVCLLAWNADEESGGSLTRIVNVLIDAGCAYFCCYGADCERVHDFVDWECVDRTAVQGVRFPHVMTTWHPRDTLAEVVHFFLRHTSLAPAREEGPGWEGSVSHSLVLEIGDAIADRTALFAALADPAAFAASYREHD